MTIEATETNLSIADVSENEVFPVEELREFRIRLSNGAGSDEVGEIIDFSEWVKM